MKIFIEVRIEDYKGGDLIGPRYYNSLDDFMINSDFVKNVELLAAEYWNWVDKPEDESLFAYNIWENKIESKEKELPLPTHIQLGEVIDNRMFNEYGNVTKVQVLDTETMKVINIFSTDFGEVLFDDILEQHLLSKNLIRKEND